MSYEVFTSLSNNIDKFEFIKIFCWLLAVFRLSISHRTNQWCRNDLLFQKRRKQQKNFSFRVQNVFVTSTLLLYKADTILKHSIIFFSSKNHNLLTSNQILSTQLLLIQINQRITTQILSTTHVESMKSMLKKSFIISSWIQIYIR